MDTTTIPQTDSYSNQRRDRVRVISFRPNPGPGWIVAWAVVQIEQCSGRMILSECRVIQPPHRPPRCQLPPNVTLEPVLTEMIAGAVVVEWQLATRLQEVAR